MFLLPNPRRCRGLTSSFNVLIFPFGSEQVNEDLVINHLSLEWDFSASDALPDRQPQVLAEGMVGLPAMANKHHLPEFLVVVPLLGGLPTMATISAWLGWIGEAARHVHTLVGHAYKASGAQTCSEILQIFTLWCPQGHSYQGWHVEAL